MELKNHTVLITGGASGIGRGIAEALYARGNKVLIAGRRKNLLDDVVRAHPKMEAFELNLLDSASLAAFAKRVTKAHPDLNMLINNAGIMRAEEAKAGPAHLQDAMDTIQTNLTAPIALTSHFLPTLQKQTRATVMMVSSGLAFVPLAMTPTYCATKAAIHSYSESLRRQLRGGPISVFELAPPYVQTELMDGAKDPAAMPLALFIEEAMTLWEQAPEGSELIVKKAAHLRHAEREGRYAKTFSQLNEAREARRQELSGQENHK